MNQNLSQFKKEFGKYGSWALWDENGYIMKYIENPDFQNLIKPDIVFVGLNASMKLPEDWINYHGECHNYGRAISWKQEHVRKLAEVLMEKEFEIFSGAYMTDVIKDDNNPKSSDISKNIINNKDFLSRNIKIFENELKMLSNISNLDKIHIICIGNKSYEVLNKITKHKIDKIWHYSAYQLGWEGVKERIRQDLRKIINKL